MSEPRENSWRSAQSGYLNRKRKTRHYRLVLRLMLMICLLLVTIVVIRQTGMISFFTTPDSQTQQGKTAPTAEQGKRSAPKADLLSNRDLKGILSQVPLLNADSNIFFIENGLGSYRITTSLNVDIQEFLLKKLDRLKTLKRGKPRNIALVVMEPDTGKIIALAGFDLDNPKTNPCYESRFPAASIFKIVTAAAALETLGFTPDTPLYFNGNKYTLYKRQLKNTRNKYSYKVSFAQAFAESINPVFGKISQNDMGKDTLDTYANAFGFNAPIDSELSFTSGVLKMTDQPYQWAEIGCGFNNDTTISPVFGAMLASTIINSGKVPVPNIVEHVTDAKGNLIYQWENRIHNSAIKSKTASSLVTLMKKTVSSGTARKIFRGQKKHPVLSKLTIGGKTGSLYNKAHTIKYDWFTGFGMQKSGSGKLAVSIVVGHGKYYGTKAGEYGRMILEQYFKQPVKLAER